MTAVADYSASRNGIFGPIFEVGRRQSELDGSYDSLGVDVAFGVGLSDSF